MNWFLAEFLLTTSPPLLLLTHSPLPHPFPPPLPPLLLLLLPPLLLLPLVLHVKSLVQSKVKIMQTPFEFMMNG